MGINTTTPQAAANSNENYRRALLTAFGAGGSMIINNATPFDNTALSGIDGHGKIGSIIKVLPGADLVINAHAVTGEHADLSGKTLAEDKAYHTRCSALTITSGEAILFFEVD